MWAPAGGDGALLCPRACESWHQCPLSREGALRRAPPNRMSCGRRRECARRMLSSRTSFAHFAKGRSPRSPTTLRSPVRGGQAKRYGWAMRLPSGGTYVCGSMSPRSSVAISSGSMRSFFALPLRIAFMQSAWPRAKRMPSRARRLASEALHPTRPSLVFLWSIAVRQRGVSALGASAALGRAGERRAVSRQAEAPRDLDRSCERGAR